MNLKKLKIGQTAKVTTVQADGKFVGAIETATQSLKDIGAMLVEMKSKHNVVEMLVEYEQQLQNLKKEAKDIVELLQDVRERE